MKKILRYSILFIPTLIILILLIILNIFHLPTDIFLELAVNEVLFETEADTSPVLNSITFKSITIEDFEYIKFNPKKIYITNPKNYSFEKNNILNNSSWVPIAFKNPIIINPNSQNPGVSVTFENMNENNNNSGAIGRIYAKKQTRIYFKILKENYINLNIKLENNRTDNILFLNNPIKIITNECEIKGPINLPYKNNFLFFNMILLKNIPEVEIMGESSSLFLSLLINPNYKENIFTSNPIYINSIDLTRQGEQGNRISSLLKDATLSYPKFPNIKAFNIRSSEIINISRLKNFIIETIQLDNKSSSINLKLTGKVGYLKIGSSNYSKNYCLSCFDIIWNNQKLVVLFSILCWLISTTIVIYKLYKELKKGE